MRRLLLVIALILFFGCAPSTVQKPEGPPSAREECVDGCLNVYSSCIPECEKTRDIGTELDNCIKQCKENWAECKENCSK
jgi:hypothetical protein